MCLLQQNVPSQSALAFHIFFYFNKTFLHVCPSKTPCNGLSKKPYVSTSLITTLQRTISMQSLEVIYCYVSYYNDWENHLFYIIGIRDYNSDIYIHLCCYQEAQRHISDSSIMVTLTSQLDGIWILKWTPWPLCTLSICSTIGAWPCPHLSFPFILYASNIKIIYLVISL